jgi:acyl-CoA thioester hydrolase
MSGNATFEQWHVAAWGDMDFNAHMANTAFLDHAADVRLAFFAEQGFPTSEMARRGIGPVVKEDRIVYRRELRLHERLRITLTIAGLSDDGARFIICNDFFREDGELAAQLRTTGGWLDLKARALTAPPEALRAALAALRRTDDFQILKDLAA